MSGLVSLLLSTKDDARQCAAMTLVRSEAIQSNSFGFLTLAWSQANIAATDYYNQCELDKIDGTRQDLRLHTRSRLIPFHIACRFNVRTCFLLTVGGPIMGFYCLFRALF